MEAGARATVIDVLAEAQRLGFIGPGDIGPHVTHAERFSAAVDAPPALALDLGSGGGLPGLVLALHWTRSRWVLLEANRRRADHLTRAVDDLGLGSRVVVDQRRAEVAGRDPDRRGRHDLVVTRSFGPPAVVAECAAPFLAVGGFLVVSEPPDRPARWPGIDLAALGLAPVGDASEGVARFRQVELCPTRFPRRNGVPAKRPLF